MKNEWNKKAKRKHLRSSKQTRPNRDGVFIGGKGIAEESELRSILENMLMDIVNQGGTISMSLEDGRLCISGKTSGMFLCDVSDKEAGQ